MGWTSATIARTVYPPPPQPATTPSREDPYFDHRLRSTALLSGRARNRAYGRLAIDLARDAAPAAAWGLSTTRNFFAARIGCETYQPIYGFDLASLCVRTKHTTR